jgi:hypothetical protein
MAQIIVLLFSTEKFILVNFDKSFYANILIKSIENNFQ